MRFTLLYPVFFIGNPHRMQPFSLRKTIVTENTVDQSYLNVDALLQGARYCGANALHPGYGFLSENADFAQAVEQAGLLFVGPTPQTIRMMGDKAVARRTAQAAGVPVVHGSAAALGNIDEAVRCAEEIGYPLLIKAAAGGGGRGIRIAANAAELTREFPIAQNESNAAFGCGDVYLKRFIQHARHIEVQILGDGERAIHLYERKCSLQRRRQKIFEEAPSPALSPTQREAICHSALQLAQQLGYRGAGTLEYLFDGDTGEFYFIEMNTRIQVEHPYSGGTPGDGDGYRRRSGAMDVAYCTGRKTQPASARYYPQWQRLRNAHQCRRSGSQFFPLPWRGGKAGMAAG